MKKFNTNSMIKATTTTLAACLLMACGGDDDSSSTDQTPAQTSFTYTTESHTFTVSLPEMGATVGKSVFSVNVQDDTGSAIANLTPTMTPMMNMAAGHQHSAPHTGCTETDVDGNAECTSYFLMPSEMNGVTMGDWSLGFSLSEGSETISFAPVVKMAMGDTALAKLKGDDNDQIPAMAMQEMTMHSMAMDSMEMEVQTEARTYFIFNNGIMTMGDNSSVELFLAAKESMMSFPTLTQNLVLNADSANELTIDTLQVQVSSDNATWVNASSQGEGIWKATEITGLTDTLYVSLSINGETKTTNGQITGDENSAAIFTLANDEMSSMDM